MCQPPKQFQHQIVYLNGSTQSRNRYQLQITEIDRYGYPVQRAHWHFQTLRGLLTFLEKHFPESTLLSQAPRLSILFQATRFNSASPMSEEIVVSQPDMPNQLHPDRELYSMSANRMKASCG